MGMLVVLAKQTLFIKSVSKDCLCRIKLHEEVLMLLCWVLRLIFFRRLNPYLLLNLVKNCKKEGYLRRLDIARIQDFAGMNTGGET